MKKIFMTFALFLTMVFAQNVCASNEELQDLFKDVENVCAFESVTDEAKSLVVYAAFSNIDEDNFDLINEKTDEILDKLIYAVDQEWYDYDYIMIDMWSANYAKCLSMTIDAKEGDTLQNCNWFTNDIENNIAEKIANNITGEPEEKTESEENLTMGQKNALKEAKSYLDYSSFSYSGLIEQLEYEGYSNEDATYAVDNCGADWNEQAAKTASDYLDYSSFSKDGLIEQLEYEGFTHEQAVYGAERNGY